MWILFAVGSAFFAGATSVLAKAGIKSVSSDFATAFRTGVVLIFSWLMVFVVGCQNAVSTITPRALVFLALSGAATGLSWLCYFKALSIGNLSKVVAVDKSSTFLTILLALIFFREPFHWLTGLGIAVMIAGTALMLEKGDAKKGERGWLFYAAGSAVFAALQSILGKMGVQDMDSTLATALRTVVVLIFAWAIVLGKKEGGDWKKMTRRDALLLVLSGITTGASWLCYYRALQTGRASVVVPIDKCSMLFAVALSAIFLKEKQTRRSLLALALVVAGTLMIALA
ncbi:MAG: EamA family transporter [Acutalibacteraceae bacterium]|nr:EamA family transporter [Acutalibacteraceae bacterium]